MSSSSSFNPASIPPDQLEAKITEIIPGDIRMFSGCKDDQTSADVGSMAAFEIPAVVGPAQAGGACTGSLVSTLERNSTISLVDLLSGMRTVLQNKGFEQIPQLTTSRKLDVQEKFSLIQPGGRPRRSLYIGINYVGQRGELHGCHNDVAMMAREFEKQGMTGEKRILLDDGRNEPPTRVNIISALSWLVEGCSAGDCLTMHYSGHGGYERDTDSDEQDGQDETIVPVDYQTKGQIIDDDIFKLLVCRVPKGARLTVVMDCCHSGSVLDLPFMFQGTEYNTSTDSPSMSVNPNFSWKKVFVVAQKLWQLHESGASTTDIARALQAEVNKDPSLVKGLMQAAGSGMATLNRMMHHSSTTTTTSQHNTTTASSSGSGSTGGDNRDLAKLGATILSAANSAGAKEGFASLMKIGSKLW
jgi:hypothetical protein